VVQLLARVSKVLAQVVVHFDTLFGQLGVQHLSDQSSSARKLSLRWRCRSG
jgi:hypothetical protein